MIHLRRSPRVAPSSQPWAEAAIPLGLKEAQRSPTPKNEMRHLRPEEAIRGCAPSTVFVMKLNSPTTIGGGDAGSRSAPARSTALFEDESRCVGGHEMMSTPSCTKAVSEGAVVENAVKSQWPLKPQSCLRNASASISGDELQRARTNIARLVLSVASNPLSNTTALSATLRRTSHWLAACESPVSGSLKAGMEGGSQRLGARRRSPARNRRGGWSLVGV